MLSSLKVRMRDNYWNIWKSDNKIAIINRNKVLIQKSSKEDLEGTLYKKQ